MKVARIQKLSDGHFLFELPRELALPPLMIALLRSFLIFVLLLAGAVSVSFAEDEVETSPIPSWASDVPIPEKVESQLKQVRGGYYYLLSSDETRLVGTTRTVIQRSATLATNREGLERVGEISVTFRPEIDRLVVHRLMVHRGEETLDVLNEVKFRVFQQETDIESGLLDGRRTALANLQDIRVGDVVEFAYSISYDPILMPEHFYDQFPADYAIPIALLHRRIIVPKDMDLSFRQTGRKVEISKSTEGEGAIYEWRHEEVSPINYEDNVPSWEDQQALVQVSSIADWSHVAQASIAGYPPQQALPVSFRAKLDKIAHETSVPAEQISRVLSLVQEEIRYVGIEIGRGAFIPRSPNLVLSRGYGDCKDKSYLMVEALRYLGHPASPALAHVGEGNSLDHFLPTPYAFDHVIVRVEAGDDIYWLDPTGTQQFSPKPQHSQANLGFVLPIAPGAKLTEIEPLQPKVANLQVDEVFSFENAFGPRSLTLTVTSRYFGSQAAGIRRTLAQQGETALAEGYREFYEGNIGLIDDDFEFTVDDNRGENRVVTIERYRFANVENDVLNEFPLRGYSVRSILDSKPEVSRRTKPFKLTYPVHLSHRISFDNLPTLYVPADDVKISRRYLDFSMNSLVQGNKLSMHWTLQTRSNEILATEYDDYRKVYSEIMDATFWTYDFAVPSFGSTAKTDNRDDQSPTIFGVAFFTAITLAVPALLIFLAYRRDRGYRDDAFYYPVYPWKFALMTIVTGGLYSVFWAYKFWRWAKAHDGAKVAAWWRGSVCNLYAKASYFQANARLSPEAKLSGNWGLVALTLGVLAALVSSALVMMTPAPEIGFGLTVLAACLFLAALLPTVITVRDLNLETDDGRTALAKNSRITIYNILGVFAGIGLYLVILNPI